MCTLDLLDQLAQAEALPNTARESQNGYTRGKSANARSTRMINRERLGAYLSVRMPSHPQPKRAQRDRIKDGQRHSNRARRRWHSWIRLQSIAANARIQPNIGRFRDRRVVGRRQCDEMRTPLP